MKKLLLVLGGTLDAPFLKECYGKFEPQLVVAADGALDTILEAGIPCDCGLGDFDTVSEDVLAWFKGNGKTRLLDFPPKKDETDAELAVTFAIEQKPDIIWIAGATGGRIDHMLGNLELLRMPLQAGIECEIVDRQNRVRLIDRPTVLEKMEHWKYVSFLSYTDQTQGITLSGFAYNVTDFTLRKGSTRCISNEICDDKAVVSFTSGMLYCIRSRDRELEKFNQIE